MKHALRRLARNLGAGTRLALMLPVRRHRFDADLSQAVLLIVLGLGASLAAAMVADAQTISTSPFWVGFEFAALLGFLLGAAVVCRVQRAPWFMVSILVVLAAAWPIQTLLLLLLDDAAQNAPQRWPAAADYLRVVPTDYALAALALAWSLAVCVRGLRLVFAIRPARAIGLSATLTGITLLPVLLLLGQAAWWQTQALRMEDFAQSAHDSRVDTEWLMYAQPDLLSDAIDALAPQRPGVVDLYFVGFAGSDDQDVFKREISLVRELFDERFDTAGHSFTYVNDLETAYETPIATVTGLDWGLYWLSQSMDTDEDVLFLYLTSHGARKMFAVSLSPLPLNQLWADDLKAMLDESGIKWRVIVISACYSGSFIESLKDENSLIITAAQADRTSFGCQNGVDYTYWGKAYFDEALRESLSFIDAFEPARASVTARERLQGYEPSNPQIFIGEAIRERLAILEARLRQNHTIEN